MGDGQLTPVPDVSHLPLKDISPNKSQPRSSRGTETHNSKDDTTEKVVTEKPSASPHRAPATSPRHSPTKPQREKKPKLMEELTSDLASILARQVSTRPGSSEPQKRKHRPLGRNLSTTSNHSGSASASPNLPPEIPESTSAVDGFAVSREMSSFQPSTQLGYDIPEAEAHRKRLSKQMGTSFHEDGSCGKRVGNIGTVKDSVDIASRSATAASRAKARRSKA